MKKAYAQVVPENITLDDFVPEADRTGRTICPAHFPTIDSYFWWTDWKISISCPQKSHETWTCPANNINTTNTDTPFETTSSGGNYFTTVGIIAVITLIVIHSIIKKESFLEIQRNFQRFDSWNVEKEAQSESTDEDDDDESSGLLGLKSDDTSSLTNQQERPRIWMRIKNFLLPEHRRFRRGHEQAGTDYQSC